MAQMVQQAVLKMEIGENCVFAQHLVGSNEVKISVIALGPSEGLMAVGVWHRGECFNWRAVEEINDNFGASCLILDVEMEVLEVSRPLLMEVILQFFLCLRKMQRPMISVDDCLLPENVMLSLATTLHNGVHLFFVSRVLTNDI
jgi:hypothetical protein